MNRELTPKLQQLTEHIKQELPVEVKTYAGEVTFVVKQEALFDLLRFLRKKEGFDYLVDIVSTDLYTDDEERFEIHYNLVNLEKNIRIRVKARLKGEYPEVESVVTLWKSANWYEREVWDMMGIKFRNHPDLRRIYLPEDFEYFPLRKEFPQLGIPGSLSMPEKDPPKEYK